MEASGRGLLPTFSGETEEAHENLNKNSRYLPDFEPATWRIKVERQLAL
jgi:hypothetical protein